MPLTLYNTLSRSKEPFEPLNPTRVGLYVCGPTVYDRAHIGNARAYVVFDLLYRLLRDTYGQGHVRYVRNITDIEDKINAAARKNGEPIAALTARTTAAFHEDLVALDALPPDVEPRATEHIPQMIAMIERLIDSGHAYAAEGHVLFAVASDPHYGEFSRRNREEMIAGARVEVAPYKRDPADFVLWKPSDADHARLGEPVGARPAGLAHRVLGDERNASRRDLRHPWRRPRSGLSRITRTRSRRVSAPMTAGRSPGSGCITGC